MKKCLSSCANCGEGDIILTQVSSGPEIIFLCSDCYNLKYSDVLQKEIEYVNTMLEKGTSADRQLKMYEETKDFKQVVDMLAEETLENC